MARNERSRKTLNGLGMITILLFIFSVLSFSAVTAAAADKPVSLKWAVFVTRDLHSMPPLIKWAKEVEEKTQGAVKIKMYFAGEIAETKDLISLCRTGTIDVISTPPVYYSSLLPLNAVLQMYYPLNKTVEQAVYTWRGLFRDVPELQQEFGNHNMHLINRSCLGLYKMVSKKPVQNLADVKGMKMRIIGGDYPSKIVQAAEAVAVFQAMQDVYEGFMRGVTDGVLLDVPAIATYRLDEIGKYIGFPWGSVLGWSTSINMDTWKKLSPEAQKVFGETAVQWGAADLENMLTNEAKFTEELKGKGVQFVDFSQDDWKQIIDKAGDPYAHCREFLLKNKVAEEVADRFLKRWKELNEEYETKYLAAGKKWDYQ